MSPLIRKCGLVAVLFTLLLSVASLAGSLPAIGALYLYMGSEGDKYSGLSAPGYVTDIDAANNSEGNAVDLEAHGGTGSGKGYLYMSFWTTHNYNYYPGVGATSIDDRPITDIIVVDFYGRAASKIAYEYNGRMYHRLPIVSKDGNEYPMNRTKDDGNHHFYLLYTRDYIDGKIITDIRVKTNENSTDPIEKEGYEVVTNENGKVVDINVSSAANYLYVKKQKLPEDDITQYDVLYHPYVRNIVYDPYSMSIGYAGASSGSSYSCNTKMKFGNKFVGDSLVKDDKGYDLHWGGTYYNTGLKPGTYDVYTRLECGSMLYARVTSLGKMTIRKITSTDYNENLNDWFFRDYLNRSHVYSGETAEKAIRFADRCLSHEDYLSQSNPPAAATFMYSTSKNGSYYTFSMTSTILKSGTYWIKATRPANEYCEAIKTNPIELTVEKSRLVIKKGNGEPDVVIEGEKDDPIDYTLPPSLTREGYYFDGWDGKVPSTMPAGETTISAKWTILQYYRHLGRNNPNSTPVYKKYTCSNGSTNSSCYSDELDVNWVTERFDYNTKLSYPTWYKVGYKHTGWTLSDGTPSKPDYMPAHVLDLYAEWTPVDYTMTFNTNGGSEVASITQGYETTVTKPTDPTKEGYAFAGWDPEIPSKMPLGNTSYTAKWTPKTYYVYFKDGASENDISKVGILYGSSLANISYPDDPTREGYTFAGWDVATLPETMPAEDITVTAQWEKNYYKVTLPSQLRVEYAPDCDKSLTKCGYGSAIRVGIQNGYKVLGALVYTGTTPWTELEILTRKSFGFIVGANDGEVKGKIAKDYGTIQIVVDGSEAIIDNDVNSTSAISKVVNVDSVTINRKFQKNFAEVVLLPFDVSMRYVRGGVFCKFMGMEKSGFNYTARLVFVSSSLTANTPYLFVPTSQKMQIKLPAGEKIAIKTSETPEVRQGDWVFRGNYDLINWEESEIENAYVFNAKASDEDGVNGSFVKATSGTLPSMSGYLVKEAQAVAGARGINGKVAPRTMSIEELPDEIGIRIETENGQTTALGQMNTATGEIKIDRWFDAQGRLLKGKPTIEGIYYNNGQKVIIK